MCNTHTYQTGAVVSSILSTGTLSPDANNFVRDKHERTYEREREIHEYARAELNALYDAMRNLADTMQPFIYERNTDANPYARQLAGGDLLSIVRRLEENTLKDVYNATRADTE